MLAARAAKQEQRGYSNQLRLRADLPFQSWTREAAQQLSLPSQASITTGHLTAVGALNEGGVI